MPANNLPQQAQLVDTAIEWFKGRLPAGWQVARSSLIGGAGEMAPDAPDSAGIEVRGPNGTYTTFVVEAKSAFGPRDVDRLLAGPARALRRLAGNVPILVVAPWISRRTQELLAREDLNYLDLTGNARILASNPALYLTAEGAVRNPDPPKRKPASLRGAKAGRLIRLLADVRPPYGVGDLAQAAELTPGYVSQLLATLDREALVDRGPRGQVEAVDVPGLLRRWTEDYDVLRSNQAVPFIARSGAGTTLEQIGEVGQLERLVVTGSFASARFTRVAASVLLMVYSEAPERLAERLDLLPADEGANVILLRPFDRAVWRRVQVDDSVPYAAPTQVAVDCLTGTGRMPAEGEALLSWMSSNESAWRGASLTAAWDGAAI